MPRRHKDSCGRDLTQNGHDSQLSLNEPLFPAHAAGLIDSVDVFIFDCDGVIWKGDSLIEGVEPILEKLRAAGKKIFFVTNNSTKSRKVHSPLFWQLYSGISGYFVWLRTAGISVCGASHPYPS